jgi:hypothetical protein
MTTCLIAPAIVALVVAIAGSDCLRERKFKRPD